MKKTVLLALATASAAFDLASLQKELPPCALLCLAQGVTAHNCQIDDFVCQCSNIEPIIGTVAPCLVKEGCSLENITTTGNVVFNVCKSLPANATETASNAPVPATATPTTRSLAIQLSQLSWLGVLVALPLLL